MIVIIVFLEVRESFFSFEIVIFVSLGLIVFLIFLRIFVFLSNCFFFYFYRKILLFLLFEISSFFWLGMIYNLLIKFLCLR